jgi:CrcB protein
MVVMDRLFWVCVGGAAGSGARYLVATWIHARPGIGFPWGTLCVNVVGSFLLGAVMQLASTTHALSPTAQAAVTIGVLGGFTTYSTFNQELLTSFQSGAWGPGVAILLATLLGCLVAGLLGQVAVRAAVGA